jgi:Leucine-rich repeat (LRR) protein
VNYIGLWRLEIRDNQLYHIAEDAFTGLTKVLTELDLQNNELTSIPTMSIRKLAKIRVLNLNGKSQCPAKSTVVINNCQKLEIVYLRHLF